MTKSAVFGGGCFWCTEAIFKRLKGVISVTPGYTGGEVANPLYSQVAARGTGHAESARVEYDPAVIKYETLLDVFFGTHDPTQIDGQGNDIGPEYRSAIFYADEQEKRMAEDYIAQLEKGKVFDKPIATKLERLGEFYEAEDYHHDYFDKNSEQPYCQVIIAPKIIKLREKYQKLLKD